MEPIVDAKLRQYNSDVKPVTLYGTETIISMKLLKKERSIYGTDLKFVKNSRRLHA